MPSLVDADMRGICALRDKEAGTVLYWFEDLKERLGDPAAAGPDVSFDETPWQQLPTFEQLWDPTLDLHQMMRDIVIQAAQYGDIEEMLDKAQQMADLEYRLKKEREHDSSAAGHQAGTGADGADGSAVAGGGGGVVPGGSEDGDAVGEVGPVAKLPNNRRPSKISGKRGSGKAG